MNAPRINTIRWGDRVQRTVALAESLNLPELFRVESDAPQVFKIFAGMTVQNPTNNPVFFGLRLNIGIGSTIINQTFLLAPGGNLLVEVPGQVIGGNIISGPALAADTWSFFAIAAPFFPMGMY